MRLWTVEHHRTNTPPLDYSSDDVRLLSLGCLKTVEFQIDPL